MADFDQLGIYREVTRTPRSARNARLRRSRAAFAFPGGGVPNANLVFRSGFTEITDTATYQIESPENTVLVTAQNSAVLVRLPPAEDYQGAAVLVKKMNAGDRLVSINIAPATSDDIDGQSLIQLVSGFSSFKLLSVSNSQWIVVGEHSLRQQIADTVVNVSNQNYTVSAPDQLIFVTTGASNRTITLPSNTNHDYWGAQLVVKKVDSGAGQVIVSGSIDGGSSLTLTTQWDAVVLWGFGTVWRVLSQVNF